MMKGVLAGHGGYSRRKFVGLGSSAAAGIALAGCKSFEGPESAAAPESHAAYEPIIDIHQHVAYSGRPDDVFLAHQRAMGISKTILLPAGRPVDRPSTHEGGSNGLQAQCAGNEGCYQFARAHWKEFRFGANEVPDL